MSLIGLLTATEKQVVTSYETHSMEFETLACLRSPGTEVVVGSKQCSERSTSTPIMSCPSAVYRHLKRRLGRTLRRLHCKRPLVQTRRRLAHKPSRAQRGFVGPKTVRAFVLGVRPSWFAQTTQQWFPTSTSRGYEIRLSLCPPLETPVVVQSKTNNVTGQRHSGSPKCHCRQTVQTQTGDSDRVVSPTGVFPLTLQEVAHWKWTYSQPDSITNFPGLCHRFWTVWLGR